jgi:hypothetical protein
VYKKSPEKLSLGLPFFLVNNSYKISYDLKSAQNCRAFEINVLVRKGCTALEGTFCNFLEMDIPNPPHKGRK